MIIDGTSVRSADTTLSLEQEKIVAENLLHKMVKSYAEQYMNNDDVPEDEDNRFFEFLESNRHYIAKGSEILATQAPSQFLVLLKHFWRQEWLTEKQTKRE